MSELNTYTKSSISVVYALNPKSVLSRDSQLSHHGVQAVTVREKPFPFSAAGITGEESMLS